MATYKKGILGAFSGTVGNVVGSSWRGIDYMRSKPNNVKNPNTDAQQTQRGKFRLVMSLLKNIKPVIQLGFQSSDNARTAFNLAASYNLKNAVTGTIPNQEINYETLMVARGSLIPAENAEAEATSSTEVSFSWNDNSGWGSANPGDLGLLLLYNTDKNRALYVAGDGPIRGDEVYSVTIPSSFEGDTLEAYIAFVSEDYAEASDSEYLGSITVPVGP